MTWIKKDSIWLTHEICLWSRLLQPCRKYTAPNRFNFCSIYLFQSFELEKKHTFQILTWPVWNKENVTIICFKEQWLHLQKNKHKKQQYVTYNNTFFASVKYIKTHLITYWYCVWNLQYWNILQNGRWMKVYESNA